MVLENPLPPYFEWLPAAFAEWAVVAVILAAAAVLLCFIFSAAQRGPMPAADAIYSRIVGAVEDLAGISPRRVLALAGLAFQEAVRRRVWVTITVFLVLLLFAGWFLDPESQDPAKLYLSFAMTATTYLVLLMALFLSVFSLPNDIAKHTIYTIVTKPVRQSEIVLGRILGFSAICTVLLALMGLFGYFFVVRLLDHRHDVDEVSLLDVTPAEGEENPIVKQGRTSTVNGHFHKVFIRKDGTGETDTRQGHWHSITSEQVSGKTRYALGPQQGLLTARVPIYGKLRFRNSSGADSATADNVGNEWTYRQYVEGGTLAALIWSFSGVHEEQFSDGLPLHMTLGVFRTHKGNIERPVLGSIKLRNPKTGLESAPINFTSREYNILQQFVPRKLQDTNNTPIDLFQHLVGDGDVEVQVSCIEPGQYFGAAQPDLYLFAAAKEFRPNFVKGYVGIWMQMLLIVGIGVMFSTFVNGPVAMMATLFTLVGGMFTSAIREMIHAEGMGGLTFESLYRMVTHAPMTTDLDPGVGTSILKGLDSVVYVALYVFTSLMPNLPDFSDVNFVAYGFDIPLNNLAIHATRAVAYLVPLFLAGYFFLKTREVAK
jgi:hypothetical protein